MLRTDLVESQIALQSWETLELCLSTTPVLKHGPRSHSPLQTETIVVSVMSNVEWTRKVVNYSCEGISPGKPWQMTCVILTCNSFILPENRGERLIEPLSSWFLSKFLLG